MNKLSYYYYLMLASKTTPKPAIGTKLSDTIFYTGSQALLKDFTEGLMWFSGGFTIIFVIVTLMKAQDAATEEAPRFTKRARTITIIGIIIFLVATIFRVVLGYYGINLEE